jgi:hypothetical protein
MFEGRAEKADPSLTTPALMITPEARSLRRQLSELSNFIKSMLNQSLQLVCKKVAIETLYAWRTK